ncbi:hypothetical protein AYL99_07252 [Fonsecaea erecta]|uniref:Uncharacterized protein n=1 Tax=Fonsecaea erecta TaxID=1367422 RepID=A0A178ZEU9_9EURO|nr:hypothetical protein AYL99_07252 [Fonsecaea erecta]OAP58162.1 hypothetical protein AYL99_07252 [Fonsecaea erecta]
MDISGRCLADLACVRDERNTNQLSLKTYLADLKADGTVSWKPSEGPGSEAKLPRITLKMGFRGILSPEDTPARLAVEAAAGGVASVLNKAADRGVDNVFYGKHHDLFEGAAKRFLTWRTCRGGSRFSGERW